METTLRDQAHLVPDPLVGHQTDPVDINQEDDFDFEIGGDDGFELAGEAENEDGNFADQVEVAQGHNDQAATYQSPEQEPQSLAADTHDDEDHEYGHQEVSASLSGPDSLNAASELTHDMGNDLENYVQDDSQNDLGLVGQEETDNNIEPFSEEEIFYEETAVEVEDAENTLQPEPVQDHDLRSSATSVGYVHEGDDLRSSSYKSDDDIAETANNAAQDSQLVTETVQNVEVGKVLEPEGHTQTPTLAAEAECGDAADDSAGTTLANNADNDEVAAESLDQANWAEDDDDQDGGNANPIVTVSYRGVEYSMFAQDTDEDPDTYFLDGVESINRPLSQFLEDVREVISSEIETGHELFVKIDGLGLEFGESTSKEFLEQTTLAQIIEVNDKLSQNDGGSQHAELYIFLSIRSNPLQRFAELAKGAEEGHGLSYFEQCYEESPADVSLLDDEEQQENSQDIDSDHLAPDEPSGENQEATDGASDFLNAAHDQNLFQVDDQQLSLNDAAVSEILGAETEQVEIEADDNTSEVPVFDGNANSVSNDAQEGDDNSVSFAATNVEAVDDNNNFGDAISAVDQVETEMGESWDQEETAEAQNGFDIKEVEGMTEEQTELVINHSEEGHERTNDSDANVPNDDDYLDLGHDADNQAATSDANATEQFDIQQRTTPNSSATATLNGEENGQANEAAAIQGLVAPADQTPNPTNQNEDDEIDWNHEDDDDIGASDQNPTDLSPSSLSAKRSRQEDEVIDGLGEDSAAKRRRT